MHRVSRSFILLAIWVIIHTERKTDQTANIWTSNTNTSSKSFRRGRRSWIGIMPMPDATVSRQTIFLFVTCMPRIIDSGGVLLIIFAFLFQFILCSNLPTSLLSIWFETKDDFQLNYLLFKSWHCFDSNSMRENKISTQSSRWTKTFLVLPKN